MSKLRPRFHGTTIKYNTKFGSIKDTDSYDNNQSVKKLKE